MNSTSPPGLLKNTKVFNTMPNNTFNIDTSTDIIIKDTNTPKTMKDGLSNMSISNL